MTVAAKRRKSRVLRDIPTVASISLVDGDELRIRPAIADIISISARFGLRILQRLGVDAAWNLVPSLSSTVSTSKRGTKWSTERRRSERQGCVCQRWNRCGAGRSWIGAGSCRREVIVQGHSQSLEAARRPCRLGPLPSRSSNGQRTDAVASISRRPEQRPLSSFADLPPEWSRKMRPKSGMHGMRVDSIGGTGEREA